MMRRHKTRQLILDIASHAVVAVKGRLGRIDIEAGPEAEIIGTL